MTFPLIRIILLPYRFYIYLFYRWFHENASPYYVNNNNIITFKVIILSSAIIWQSFKLIFPELINYYTDLFSLCLVILINLLLFFITGNNSLYFDKIFQKRRGLLVISRNSLFVYIIILQYYFIFILD
jgi:hypothetical protein